MIGLAFIASPAHLQDLRQTPHDLRSRLAPGTRDESAMCVFCHAPVGERAASALRPRWQPSESGIGGFSLYAAPMDDSTNAREIPGASMICLSCHDATQAPGIAGGVSDHPIGIPYASGAGTDVGGVWQPATIDEQARAHRLRMQSGAAVAGGVSDHPIGIPYAGEAGTDVGGVWQPATIDEQARAHRLRIQSRAAAGARLIGRTGFRPASRSVIDQRAVWWVATSANSARRTRNDLPLYGDVEAGSGPASGTISAPTIECGTCHDPHATTPMFLRIPNNGSRLCLSCHDV